MYFNQKDKLKGNKEDDKDDKDDKDDWIQKLWEENEKFDMYEDGYDNKLNNNILSYCYKNTKKLYK